MSHIDIPPLRERPKDIRRLTELILQQTTADVPGISRKTLWEKMKRMVTSV